ncbi:sulfatase-like hydrolase/transferase [Thalassotalea litorea]|nr:sulfatase-like hydrolase/transferase [Thalassotalea litorea]
MKLEKEQSAVFFNVSIPSIILLMMVSLTMMACNSASMPEHGTQASPARPNILFILADDHRWDLIGKYHPIIKTPNLDRLANKGTVFTNAFVTTPICATSRVSILTSLTERTHDFTFGRPATGIDESNSIYPKILKDNGYRSAFVGKYEIKLSGKSEDKFDYFKELLQTRTVEYQGEEIPQTYHIAELAKAFIAQPENDNTPWVMAVNFWDPHAHDSDQENQYHYPEEFEQYYQHVTIPDAKFSRDTTFAELPQFLQESIGHVRWQYRYGSDELYQKMVKRHYRAISGVDKAVGMIYAELEKQGIADDTVIIYAGDNGYNINERQLAGKWFGWEEDLRIPLIIYDPRNKAAQGQEKSEMALNIDIAPTILALAGVQAPKSYQGESLVPLLQNDQHASDSWRQEFFFEHMYQPKRVSIPPTVGMRTKQWKYVDFYKHDFQQLYDLTKDPQEAKNLANSPQHQAILKELSERTDVYIQEYERQRTSEVKQRTSFVNQRNEQDSQNKKNNEYE